MAPVTRFRHFLNKNWVLDTVFRSQYPRAPGKPKSVGERPKAPGKAQKRRGKAKKRRGKPKSVAPQKRRPPGAFAFASGFRN